MSEAIGNLVITGMMGTGKTSVSEVVAKHLSWPVVETDQEIEKRFGKTIPDIFRIHGESAFRDAEWKLCQDFAKERGLVISTGGGFLLRLQAQEAMRGHAIFCLDASAETIEERTRVNNDRPLLEGSRSERFEKIRNLLEERRAHYQRIFHHVSTDGRTKQDIASEVLRRFALEREFSATSTQYIRMPLESPYPVVVQRGIGQDLARRLKWMGQTQNRVIILTNATLKSLYGKVLEASLKDEELQCQWIEIPDGEQYKNLETVQTIYHALLSLNAKRDDIIIAFGGGVVGDIAGFIAATYMRGLAFVQVPTTLLAMVDSSIGGKTGVDLDAGKNLIGAFKQPLMVLADPQMLSSLMKEDFHAGMAEVIKHALIDDRELFDMLSNGKMLQSSELVFRALKVKAKVVEADPFEKSQRALLNFGHTFGHAIEKVSDYTWRHGYAVAVGMIAACELSSRLGVCAPDLRSRVEAVVKRYELPTRVRGLRASDIVEAMRHDKKASSSDMRFVLIHDVGDVRLTKMNDVDLVKAVVETVIQV